MSANKQKHQPLLYIAQPEIKPPAVAMQSKYSIKKEEKNASAQLKESIADPLAEKQPESSAASAVHPALQEEQAEKRISEEQSYEPFSTLRKAASFRRVKHFKELDLEEKLEDLAEKAGISCSFVGHIERGEKKASLETLIALCNALRVSPALLLQDSLDGEVVKDNDSKLVDNIIDVLREHKRWDVEYGQSQNQ